MVLILGLPIIEPIIQKTNPRSRLYSDRIIDLGLLMRARSQAMTPDQWLHIHRRLTRLEFDVK